MDKIYGTKTRTILLIYLLLIGQQIQCKDQDVSVAATRSCCGMSEMYHCNAAVGLNPENKLSVNSSSYCLYYFIITNTPVC